MSKVIPVHSFRRGTGKSTIAVNLATLSASQGRRVGIVDTNLQSPSVQRMVNLDDSKISYRLNDFLLGRCDISQAIYDVTAHVSPALTGRIFIVPANADPAEAAYLLHKGYNVDAFHEGLRQIRKGLELDTLLIDMQAGLNEETLPVIAIAHTLLIVLGHDQRDYQGTSVIVEVAHKLGVPRMLLAVNEMPAIFDPVDVRDQMQQTYQCEVAAVLSHVEELAALAGSDIFCLRYPDHPMTRALRESLNALQVRD